MRTLDDQRSTAPLWQDADACYRAVSSRDHRFDGLVVLAVRTTGIYCRPSCPARTPARVNVEFLPTGAAALERGYRACKRCRPDAVPGSPEWNTRGDVAARVVRYIADGVVDRDGVGGLARRVGYGTRQLHRVLVAETGAGALTLAREHRARTARHLFVATSMPVSDVAVAAGFSSVRQCYDTLRSVYDATPGQLRARTAPTPDGIGPYEGAPAPIRVRLAARAPFAAAALHGFLAARTVTGIEFADADHLRRSLSLPRGHGVVEIRFTADGVEAGFRLEDVRDLAPAVGRVRRWLDLDADPMAVDGALSIDRWAAASVRACPGRRVPGTVDPFESVVRTIIGQQVSVAGARTVAGRVVAVHGELLRIRDPWLTHVFPSHEALAAVDPDADAGATGLAMPRRRARTVVAVADRVARGVVDLGVGADRDRAVEALRAIPGVGAWTVDHVRMQALGDPDVFLTGDLGLRRALDHLGIADPDVWRPWRSYAVHHLWAADAAPPPTPPRSST